MRKCAALLLMVTVGVSAACHRETRVIIPNAGWEPIFFRSINSAAKLSGQTDLRTTHLPKGDLEVRIWWGFGLSPLEGATLRRADGQWSAIHVRADNYHEPTNTEQRLLSNPTSGWETMWARLVKENILSLPDASEINCNVGGLDGIATVVEISADDTYRTYMYDMPSELKCKEAENILAIADIIFEEFNLKSS